MIGIVIVDGTGTDVTGWQNDEQYKIDYGNSHCSKIHKMFPGSTYQRGPAVDGAAMGSITQAAIQNCRSFAKAPSCTGLILIGHSRGAAAVIGASHQMNAEGVEVEFMGLFDAVEMDFNMSYNVDYIPANVKNVRHGERFPQVLLGNPRMPGRSATGSHQRKRHLHLGSGQRTSYGSEGD